MTPREAAFLLDVAGEKEENAFILDAKMHGATVKTRERPPREDERARRDDCAEVNTEFIDRLSLDHTERLKQWQTQKSS